MDNKDVSVIICTMNSCKNIKRIVECVLKNNPLEVIVVDGHSTDGTLEILKNMPVKIYEDEGKGLGLARQIGLVHANGRFILYVGDDNLISGNSISKLKTTMIKKDWIGCGMLTGVERKHKNYWSLCSDIRLNTRIYPGERDVIGTPHMFYRDLLMEVGYDSAMTGCDDTDVEHRMIKKTGKKVGYANVKCLEIGEYSFTEVKRRFTLYGRGDSEFWEKYSPEWGWRRKLRSILHPIRDELIVPIRRIPLSQKAFVFPFLVLITMIRYYGWISSRKRIRRRS